MSVAPPTETGEPGIGELVARVVNEAVELASAEFERARAEIDERSRYGAQLAWRAGVTLVLAAVALQAFALAAIVWSGQIFGGYVVGSLVVGGVFLGLAAIGGLFVRRSVIRLADPTVAALPAGEPRRALPAPEDRS